MPWSHCDVQFILDTEACPACGLSKDVWTIQIEKTRQLVIGKRRKKTAWIDVELRDPKGAPSPGKTYRAEFANGRVKTGELDADGRARFKQLFPGPVQVTFPEVELETGTRRGQRQVLAAPLADAVRRRPEPLGGWELQTLAASAARPTPSLGALQLLNALPLAEAAPPAEAPAEPVAEGDPLKAELALQVTFASRAQAQAWLLRNAPQVHVDGERVSAGAYVRDQNQIVLQFRVPPGEHHVLVSTERNQIRTVYASRRLEIESDAPAAPAEQSESAPANTWVGATPSRTVPSKGAPSKGVPSKGVPSKAGPAQAGPSQGAPSKGAPSKGVPAKAGPAQASARGGLPAQVTAPAQSSGRQSGGARSAGSSANPLAQLIQSEFAPDPIGLSREQIERGAGELYVFQPPADTLKASIALQVTFASRREAQRWLLSAGLRVHVDGELVAHGAYVEGAQRVLVQFRLEPGEHHVMVSGTRSAAGGDLRTVFLSRRITLSDGSGSGAVQSAPPPPPAKRAKRAPGRRGAGARQRAPRAGAAAKGPPSSVAAKAPPTPRQSGRSGRSRGR